ncbi:TetR/AcrR family transcriptional regulator [Actinomadura parmotrematis]|uniref:TetR/AcrR family transcriptional regulator n=1 Tax=Actinomadura parmotrematis TaxID=2864039 RepID=A0ABS7G1B2_9ACTN|nr:TetR/AcrR family transcriptional regulator [Actinomadura parmotrematis]MBW8486467.1 TetR/AcrR family transcriptional regulator [Actinomadura parmotrematis]
MTDRPYHHGDLRRALLRGAAELIAERGPAAFSLRDLARRTGVSHAAPAHHFGDRTGLFTALGAEGYALLADALAGGPGELSALGARYVAFATDHPSHFQVMFRADLVRDDDPELAAARDRAGALLRAAVAGNGGTAAPDTVLAAWALAHGFASLAGSGALAGRLAGAAPAERFPAIARAAARLADH